MGFLKGIGVILLLLSGIALGGYLNRSACATLGQIEAFEKLLEGIRLQVDCFSLPVGEILSRTEPSLLSQCGWHRSDAPRDLGELMGECAVRDGETERLMSELSSEFGRGYREEQLRRCDCYLRALDARKVELRSKLQGRKKLNLTLCTAAAAAIALLFA